jgi:hypothetical protein
MSYADKEQEEGGKHCSVFGLILMNIYLAYSSTLKMEAICSSETSRSRYTTRHYNQEDRALYVITVQTLN